MADHRDLEQIYTDAKSALKVRDYDRARGLLTSILAVDENYRDASRLLAQTVRLRRRRWHNHPALWMVIGLAVLVGLGIVIAPKLQGSFSRQISSPTQPPTVTQPIQTTAVSSPTSAATPIPLTWSRLSLAQILPRDTIHAIAINPSDPDVIYIVTQHAGVYKSINGGVSWQPAQNGMEGASIDTLVIDPQQPETLYAGVYQGGLYTTTDGGANWVSYGSEFTVNYGDSFIVIDPANHQHLYYDTSQALRESHDSGETWPETSQDCPNQVGALLLDPADQSLYASQSQAGGSCTSGVYRYQSGDYGWTWTLVGLNGVNDINGLYIGKDLRGDKLLIAKAESEKSPDSISSPSHVYFSTDHGKTWNTQAIACNTLAVDPQTTTTFYCAKTNGGLIKSTDGGITWKSFLGVNSGTYQAISVLAGPSPRLVLGGTNVAISADQGASWTNYDSGLPGQQVDLTLDPSNASIFYVKSVGSDTDEMADCDLFYRSIDTGRTWNQNSSAGCGLTFGPGGIDLYRIGLYQIAREMGGVASVLFHSTDQGAHWTNISLPSYNVRRVYANPFVPGALIIVAYSPGPNSFFYSNFGYDWRPSSGSDRYDPLVRLFFSGSTGQRVYAVYSSPPDYRSDDGGKSWYSCGDANTQPSFSDSRLIIDPHNPDHILEATQGYGVAISTDGCWSWKVSNAGLGSLLVNTLAHDPKNANTIYAGTDGGAYVSFDGGQSWGQINGGLLGANVVYSIVVDPQSNVYAATPYGIFKLESK